MRLPFTRRFEVRALFVAALLLGAPSVSSVTSRSGHAGARLTAPAEARAEESAPASAREANPGGVEAEEPEAGEHGPSLDLGKLALQLLNFAVLLFILIKFGGGAINKMLAARHAQLKADLASASALRAAAEAKLGEQEGRLVRLEAEIAAMRAGIHAEAESEKQRLMAAAHERTRRIEAETTFLVEQQVRESEARLRRESADAALKMAEELLRRSVGPADQQNFLERFIAGVDAGGPAKVTPGSSPPGKAGPESATAGLAGGAARAEGVV
jgi:F-type H+-transporting ATPase subunit b